MTKTSKKAKKKTRRPSTLEIMLKEKFGDKGVKVYDLIDGVRNVKEIRKETGMTEKGVEDILKFLEQGGFIKMDYPEKKSASSKAFDIFTETQFKGKKTKEVEKLSKGKSFTDANKYFNRGNELLDKRDYEKAIVQYNMALLLKPTFSEAYFNRALCYYRLENFDKSIVDYSKAAELDPTNPFIYNNRGDCHYQKDKFQEAIKDYNKAIELDPKYMKAYYNRGLCYANIKEYEKSIADYTKAIKLKPDFGGAYEVRGLAYEYNGDLKSAETDYLRALRLDPELKEAKQHLDGIRAKLEKKLKEAREADRGR